MEPSPKISTVILQDSLTQGPLHPHSNAESPGVLIYVIEYTIQTFLKVEHQHIRRIVFRNVMTLIQFVLECHCCHMAVKMLGTVRLPVCHFQCIM